MTVHDERPLSQSSVDLAMRQILRTTKRYAGGYPVTPCCYHGPWVVSVHGLTTRDPETGKMVLGENVLLRTLAEVDKFCKEKAR